MNKREDVTPGLEKRVKNFFKIEKDWLYTVNGGMSDPDGMNDVWLTLAAKFKMPVRQVKDIVYPQGWMD
jgi:hypothetical protein